MVVCIRFWSENKITLVFYTGLGLLSFKVHTLFINWMTEKLTYEKSLKTKTNIMVNLKKVQMTSDSWPLNKLSAWSDWCLEVTKRPWGPDKFFFSLHRLFCYVVVANVATDVLYCSLSFPDQIYLLEMMLMMPCHTITINPTGQSLQLPSKLHQTHCDQNDPKYFGKNDFSLFQH